VISVVVLFILQLSECLLFELDNFLAEILVLLVT
jgi:hypothetical protein